MSDKKPLALVGFAPSTRDAAPYYDLDWEIWTINHAPHKDWMKRFDVLFDVHPLRHIKRSIDRSDVDKMHWEWLQQEHDFPIYMMEKYEECPASVRFPIEDLREKFGDFYTSSFAFMMALAIMQGYERIDIYGFDMAGDSEYNYQRDSAEYFIGLAIGMGIDVGIPDKSQLLKGKVYAFEDNNLGFRQQLELRQHSLDDQKDAALNDYYVLEGYVEKMEKLLPDYPDVVDYLKQADAQAVEQRDLCCTIDGAVQETVEHMKMYDKFFNLIGDIKKEDIAEEASNE